MRFPTRSSCSCRPAFPHAEIIIHEDPAGIEESRRLPAARVRRLALSAALAEREAVHQQDRLLARIGLASPAFEMWCTATPSRLGRQIASPAQRRCGTPATSRAASRRRARNTPTATFGVSTNWRRSSRRRRTRHSRRTRHRSCPATPTNGDTSHNMSPKRYSPRNSAAVPASLLLARRDVEGAGAERDMRRVARRAEGNLRRRGPRAATRAAQLPIAAQSRVRQAIARLLAHPMPAHRGLPCACHRPLRAAHIRGDQRRRQAETAALLGRFQLRASAARWPAPAARGCPAPSPSVRHRAR